MVLQYHLPSLEGFGYPEAKKQQIFANERTKTKSNGHTSVQFFFLIGLLYNLKSWSTKKAKLTTNKIPPTVHLRTLETLKYHW